MKHGTIIRRLFLNNFDKKIKRNNWGNLEEDGRGENPWSSLDKLERKHFTQLYSLIKNES